MKYLSLFTGIGGFELGIKQAYETVSKSDSNQRKVHPEQANGGHLSDNRGNDLEEPLCVGYSEIDKYATAIYQGHFPEHINYGDITKIDADALPDFDFLCGGFPCQAFSIAGKRKGFDDTRGTLFFDIARILRAKQPRLFLLENVKGLLSHDNGKTFSTIISTLDELGYDLQWQVLNSKNHGVPQNRERVFIVGHLRGTPRPKVFPFTGANGKDIEQLNSPTHSNDRIYGDDGISPTLNTMQGGMRQPKIQTAEFKKKLKEVLNDETVTALDLENGAFHKDRFMCLQEPHHNKHRLVEKGAIRRLTPTECERLQGFPDGWTEGVSDTQRYKTLGNAVTVNVIQHIMQKLLPEYPREV